MSAQTVNNAISNSKQIGNTLHKSRNKNWKASVDNAFLRKYRSKPTASLLGAHYPTTRTLALKNTLSSRNFTQLNTCYWSRISNGTRTTKDKGLIARVDADLPGTAEVLSCVLLDLLQKPHINNKDISLLMNRLRPTLEGRVFQQSENKTIIQKKGYWCYGNIKIANSKELLAYKLIQLKRSSNQMQDNNRLSGITLLLLRILLTSSLRKIAEPVLSAYESYLHIHAHQQNNPGQIRIDTSREESVLKRLAALSFPKTERLPAYFDNFNLYSSYHDELVKKAQRAMFGTRSLILLSETFSTEILYWTDRFHDHWLNKQQDKFMLFDKSTSEYKAIVKYMHFKGSRHQIW